MIVILPSGNPDWQRFSDLTAMYDKLNINLYLVAYIKLFCLTNTVIINYNIYDH